MIERYSRPEMAKIWSLQNKFQKWLDLEIFAVEAHVKNGDVPAAALPVIQSKAAFDVKRIDELEKELNHDVIAFLTNVAENVGPESRFIHLGLTSSDVVDTCLSAQIKEAGLIILQGIKDLMVVVKTKALQYQDTLMMGRTHGIHAEPMTFGLKLALWYEELGRDLLRMERAIENIAVGKISGAVGTYANINPNVEVYVCEKMGLKPAPVSTQIIQRDRHAEFLTTVAIIGSSLEKFATEIRNLQRTDLAEVAEPFGKGQKGSSAMPHKRNPITNERIAGLARVLRGNAIAALENVALWHERDITHSSVERVIFPDSTGLLDYMLRQFTWVIEGLDVYPQNMLTNVNKYGGIVSSQRLLLHLIKAGMLREDAYRLVQGNALRARDENGSFKENVKNDPLIMQHVSATQLEELFDHRYHLKNVTLIMKRVFA
jgi:adenylosuccinate lyase